MKITTEPIESCELRLTIEIDEDQTQQAMRRAARRISKQVNIPGFRKGKAPYDLVVSRFGEETVRQEAAETLIEKVYAEALDQEEIEPFAPGTLEDVGLDPITFWFTIPLAPKVDLGDYGSYRLKYKQPKVAKKQVKQALEQIRLDNAILEQVERPVELGDGAVVSIRASIDDEQIIQSEDTHIMVEADSAYPAPGFNEAVVGMAVGDERSFTLPLPDDFPRQDLQGQEAQFTVEMVEVYDQTLPDLDDDLARTVGNFDTLEELKDHIRGQLEAQEKREVDEGYTDQIMEDLVEQATIEYPAVLLENILDEMMENFEQMVKKQTTLSLEDFLRLQNRTEQDMREQFTPDAQARLEHGLVLNEIIERENLQVKEEEVAAQIKVVSASWGVRADEVHQSLSSDESRRGIHDQLLSNKALQRLMAIAKGEADSAQEEQEQSDAQQSEENEEDDNG